MEIHVFPQNFAIIPAKVQTSQGEVPVMRIQVADVGGTMVHVTFGMQDWAQFVEACKDPVGAARKAEARSKLIVAQNAMRPPRNDKR